jgi:hypothetical protein
LLNSPASRLTVKCPEPLSSRTTADLRVPHDAPDYFAALSRTS